MEQQIEEKLENWDSENATEVVSSFQEMFNQMTTFNEQMRLEQEERVHQLTKQEIKIADCLIELKNHCTELNDRESTLKKRETNLEEKLKEMTAAITEYDSKTKARSTPSEDQVKRIENQVQQGLTRIQQYVNDFNNI